MGKYPAPIDDKNVMTDWIEEIFDSQSAIYSKNCCLGFIKDQPVMATWSRNVIIWTMLGCAQFATLIERLQVYNNANSELVTEEDIIGNTMIQQFFWKND